MPSTTERARFDRDQSDVFDYVAEMSHLAQWDPAFAESRRVGSGPIGIGTRFDAVLGAAGITRELTLEIVEYERPHRVVFEGVGEGFTTKELITVEDDARGGCELTYESSFETEKPDLVDVATSPLFQIAGKAAIAGLRRQLSSG